MAKFEPVLVRWLTQEIEFQMINTRTMAAKYFSTQTGIDYSVTDINCWIDGTAQIPRDIVVFLALKRTDRLQTELDTGWKKTA